MSPGPRYDEQGRAEKCRMAKHNLHILCVILACLAASPALAADTAQHRTAALSGDVEVDLRIYPGSGETVVLGFPCDQGTGTADEHAAVRLAKAGVEVWLADLLSAHFLPIAPSSMRQLGGAEVAQLIEMVHRETGKRVILLASGYGSIPALRGARDWQAKAPAEARTALVGAVLLFPKLYAEEPQPGRATRYLPVVGQTRMHIDIVQPQQAPDRFWINRLSQELANGGSQVSTHILPGVRNFFYSRPSPNPAEIAAGERLDRIILGAVRRLQQTESKP